jgi:hypothetical protein
MDCHVSEKPLRLVYVTFYLAIGDTFYEFINIVYLMKIFNNSLFLYHVQSLWTAESVIIQLFLEILTKDFSKR